MNIFIYVWGDKQLISRNEFPGPQNDSVKEVTYVILWVQS